MGGIMATTPPYMTREEYARLTVLEAVIQRTWELQGQALAEIKRDKLYRRTREGEKQTWAQYCQRLRRPITPQWANQLIRSARIASNLRAASEGSLSLSASAVGGIAHLNIEEQLDILSDVEESGQTPTAQTLETIANRRAGGDGLLQQSSRVFHFKVTVLVPGATAEQLDAFRNQLEGALFDYRRCTITATYSYLHLDVAYMAITSTIVANTLRTAKFTFEPA
jgi:hypothetical protein